MSGAGTVSISISAPSVAIAVSAPSVTITIEPLMSLQIGTEITVTATFQNLAGIPTDPTTVTFKLKPPNASQIDYVYGVSTDVTKLGTGVYQLVHVIGAAGIHVVRAVGSGAISTLNAAGEQSFAVAASGVSTP